MGHYANDFAFVSQAFLQLLMIWMFSGPLLKESHTMQVTAQLEMNNGKVLRVLWQHLFLPTFCASPRFLMNGRTTEVRILPSFGQGEGEKKNEQAEACIKNKS